MIAVHVLVTAFCQGILVTLLFNEVIGKDLEDFKKSFGSLIHDPGIICARAICTIILHLSQQDEVKCGLDLMKYAVNNEHRFMNWKKAFMMGFLQAGMTILVETVNMLVILQSNTTKDIVFNFIAVAIISDFDNFVFASLRNEPLKELVNPETSSEFLQISFTTSAKARPFSKGGEASDQIDDNGDPICMKISFIKDRDCVNKLFRIIYKVFRIFFVSIYFYYYPALAVWITFQVPIFFRKIERNSWVTLSDSLWNPAVTMSENDYNVLKITKENYAEYLKKYEAG